MAWKTGCLPNTCWYSRRARDGNWRRPPFCVPALDTCCRMGHSFVIGPTKIYCQSHAWREVGPRKGSFITNTRGLRHGGLTPACGSAHARHGRGCREIEAVNATVLPRGALRSSMFAAGRGDIEKQSHPAPYAKLYIKY